MRWKSAAFVIFFCGACCLAVARAQAQPFFNENLLSNPGAEEGAASPDGMTMVTLALRNASGAVVETKELAPVTVDATVGCSWGAIKDLFRH